MPYPNRESDAINLGWRMRAKFRPNVGTEGRRCVRRSASRVGRHASLPRLDATIHLFERRGGAQVKPAHEESVINRTGVADERM